MSIKSYELKHCANKGKIDTISRVLGLYRKLSKLISSKQWRYFQKNYSFNKYPSIEGLPNLLSERYKRVCTQQVLGMLKSWISNRQNEFQDKIIHSALSTPQKKHLLKLNNQHKWYEDETAKSIWRLVCKRHRLPSFNNINMNLDAKVCKINTNTGKSSFDYWLQLSTDVKGKPILIPLKTNKYFDSKKGSIKKFVQINQKDDNFSIRLIKKLQSQEYKPKTKKIGLDTGLVNILTDDSGSLYGRNFYLKLQDYDFKTTQLIKELQKHKIKPSHSPKYKRLVSKFRSWLKNEINRIINRIVNKYKPEEICVERLNFQGSKLSRRTNRLLGIFGKSIIKKKLESLNHIKTTEVNPAYTSQTCPCCRYIDKKNRKERNTFKCLYCGKILYADVAGAKNIVARSSSNEISIYTSKREVLRYLCDKFMEQLGRYDSLAEKTLQLLKGNLYFRSYLEIGSAVSKQKDIVNHGLL